MVPHCWRYVLFLLLLKILNINMTAAQLPTPEDSNAQLKKDGVWEEMVRQAWRDYINTINSERELYGVKVEPLQLGPLLGENLHLEQSILGYQVNLSLWDVWVHGLSSLLLRDVAFLRDESLSMVKTYAILEMETLDFEGSYSMEGRGGGPWSWLGADQISSQGAQKFIISMKKVEIRAELDVNLVEGCSEDSETPVVTRIEFPIKYDNVNFTFNNLGSVLDTVVSLLGDLVIERQRKALVSLIKTGIARESESLLCETWSPGAQAAEMFSTAHHWDKEWQYLLDSEDGPLQRDRLAEQTVITVFRESIKAHLHNTSSPLRQFLDPLLLFPLEFNVKNDAYRAKMVVCDNYLHNIKNVQNEKMELVRDQSLNYSALRVEAMIPITWMTGKYQMKDAYLFSFIPAGGAGDFNVDLVEVRVKLIVVLRNTDKGLDLEYFQVGSNWSNTVFKFDGLWKGLGDLADKIMNQMGVGTIIVEKQKWQIMQEVKNYLRGLAVCAMWSPSVGIELCMRQFWIDLGWSYPWEYPTCD